MDQKMDGNRKVKNKNGFRNGITKEIKANILEWSENITSIDLSNMDIEKLEDNLKFPISLTYLNLSRNKIKEVPNVILKLGNLKTLDLSSNYIELFDDTPNFCHTIENLYLSKNHLKGPPYWVWCESPKKLTHLNLSDNLNITQELQSDYYDELLQYTVKVNEIVMYNCRLKKHLHLIGTFCKAKVIELGIFSFSCLASNNIEDVPCPGLDKCYDIQRLNLSNTEIYNVHPNISLYKNLTELNLSQNKISNLPNEFSYLENLEICILSYNHIFCLPDNIGRLKNLIRLHVDNNELCMLPNDIFDLPCLKVLDLYNNNLYEIPEHINNMSEVDLAQNYCEEPDDAEYLERKERLRLNHFDRTNGRKIEVISPESEYSRSGENDEELQFDTNTDKDNESIKSNVESLSEDWDSDEYWVPGYDYTVRAPSQSPWLYFVKKKMAEGNFCPMDIHPISIAEQVKYEKLCNPTVEYESDGQFDDYSEDDS